MNRIRVLYISNEDYQIGGSSLSLLNMLQALGEDVEPVLLFRAEGPVAEFFRDRGYRCIVEPFYRASFNADGLLRWIRFIPHAIARTIAQRRCINQVTRVAGDIDLVHSNSSTVDIGLRIARRLSVPHIWHLREYYDAGGFAKPFPSWASWKRKLLSSEAIIAITPGLYNHWNLSGHSGAFCIPDAVCSKENVPGVDSVRDNKILFISAKVSPLKRPEEAVRIFSLCSFSGYRLLIVGTTDPEMKSRLDELSFNLGVSDRVVYVPFVNDIRPLLMKAAAVLVCTENEGMGRVAVEAMFAGCPVVARNSGGSCDVLGNGRFGRLYNTVGEGAAQLKEVVSHFPENQVHMAQQEAVAGYAMETYGEKVKAVYSSICQR